MRHVIRTASALLLGLYCGYAANAAEVRFDDLVSHPSRFHRQHVTVTGIAEVSGGEIFLWRDAEARRRVDLKNVITVLQRLDDVPRGSVISPHSEANLRRVRVTGMVDTRLRGRFGDERFQLMLEQLEVIPGPRFREFLPTMGYFRNETSHDIRILAYNRSGHIHTETAAGPKGHTEVALQRGTVVATTPSGRQLARREVMTPQSSKSYFDVTKKAYYFRITSTSIVPVSPAAARAWDLGYSADRD